MFAYGLNNPINLSDFGGNYSVYSSLDPCAQAGWELGNWLGNLLKTWWTKTKHDESKGNITNSVKVKNAIASVVENIEFSAGIGQGLYGELEFLELSVSIGMYGNYATINYQDGKWFTGQEVYTGASISATQFIEVGFGEYAFLQGGKPIDISSWYLLNTTQESYTIFGAACYPLFLGGSVRIGFDILTFLEDFEETWGR